MTIENIDVEETIKNVKHILSQEKKLSPALRSAIELMILLVTLLVNRMTKNSRNSSKPPSSDPNRERKKKNSGKNKPGGQKGHVGTTLNKVITPDETLEHKVSKCEKCNNNISKQKVTTYETRQVFNVEIKVVVTEHKAEVKKCICGFVNTGIFPEKVTKSVQYGSTVKALSSYMSLYQLIPYKRVEDFFRDQVGLPISAGSIFNFNLEAYKKLETFEIETKEKLLKSFLNHCDETGININGGRGWLHCLSNDKLTLFYPHVRRGAEAIDEMGVLPNYRGIICHDHWKPYFNYASGHSLCNAHHIRELEFSHEQEKQKWAKLMLNLLLEINKATEPLGKLLESDQKKYQRRYRTILTKGKVECPIPPREKGKRGRIKKSKARNLLERLENHEESVLLFMKNDAVPFTNNQAENDIRMTKVHQKISGCFRSMEGAKIFCRVRSYISTARKNLFSSHQALNNLFNDLPFNYAE